MHQSTHLHSLMLSQQKSYKLDPLIGQLIARRDALLHKLSQLREDYTTKETTRKASIQELETNQQLQQMNPKVNKNIPIHQKPPNCTRGSGNTYQIPDLSPTLQTLRTLVSEFGGGGGDVRLGGTRLF